MSVKVIHFLIMMGIPVILFIFRLLFFAFTIKEERSLEYNTHLRYNFSDSAKFILANIGLTGFLHMFLYTELLPVIGLNIDDKLVLFAPSLLIVFFAFVYLSWQDIALVKVKRKINALSNGIPSNRKTIKERSSGLLRGFLNFFILKKSVKSIIEDDAKELSNFIKESREKLENKAELMKIQEASKNITKKSNYIDDNENNHLVEVIMLDETNTFHDNDELTVTIDENYIETVDLEESFKKFNKQNEDKQNKDKDNKK